MFIEKPPNYPRTRIVASLTADPHKNRIEMENCVKKAIELECDVIIPEGNYPVSNVSFIAVLP